MISDSGSLHQFFKKGDNGGKSQAKPGIDYFLLLSHFLAHLEIDLKLYPYRLK